MEIGFFQHQLCLRGTTVALFDYVCGNEDILKNKSFVFYIKNHPSNNPRIIKKFQDRLTDRLIPCDSFNDKYFMDKKIKVLYVIKYGTIDNEVSRRIPTLIHSVFAWQPHGDMYTCVSRNVATKNEGIWLPHIVNPLPKVSLKQIPNFRIKFGIPEKAFVYGRYGGEDTFSIEYVKKCIRDNIDKLDNTYFLFCNTYNFIDHPRVIFISEISDAIDKAIFIDSCNCMIHARQEGETFGLAIAEFALRDKPVLTCRATITEDNEHIVHLRDRALIYSNEESLLNHLIDMNKKDGRNKVEWTSKNPYSLFNSERIMKFFNGLVKQISVK